LIALKRTEFSEPSDKNGTTKEMKEKDKRKLKKLKKRNDELFKSIFHLF
jgi:hypothetical protein